MYTITNEGADSYVGNADTLHEAQCQARAYAQSAECQAGDPVVISKDGVTVWRCVVDENGNIQEELFRGL